MARIKTVNKFLTKLDIFSRTLGGDKCVRSSVLMPVIASMKKMLQEDSSDHLYIARMKEVIPEGFTRWIAKTQTQTQIFPSWQLRLTHDGKI